MTEGFKPSPEQRKIFSDISNGLENSPIFEIEIPPSISGNEMQQIFSTIALVLLRVQRANIPLANPSPISDIPSSDLRPFVRRHSATIINNPPGSRNLREANNGFEHSIPGYSKRGRNHGDRTRAVK